MIEIKENKNCSGCEACRQICPSKCIVMQEDCEGFLYPKVDENNCINCGLCEKVCPIINASEYCTLQKVYAAKCLQEKVRKESSSGGIFTVLAQAVIDKNGVVFGARFNKDWEVVHDYIEKKEDISFLRGSKYVQSKIGDSYIWVEFFLKKGRLVLFSGTPCQVAGLNHYLRKKYENLLLVDFICHGVPSPKVWRMYLDETIMHENKKVGVYNNTVKNGFLIKSISFRDKTLGWMNFSFSLILFRSSDSGEKQTVSLIETHKKNIYLKGFLSDLFLRPSCHHCCFKKSRNESDIMLGDFWGIKNVLSEWDDRKGTSVVIINTSIGESFFSSIKQYIHSEKTPLGQSLLRNSAFEQSAPISRGRYLFFSRFRKYGMSCMVAILTSFLYKVFNLFIKIIAK